MILRTALLTALSTYKTPSSRTSPEMQCVLQLGTVHSFAGMCIYMYLHVFVCLFVCFATERMVLNSKNIKNLKFFKLKFSWLLYKVIFLDEFYSFIEKYFRF